MLSRGCMEVPAGDPQYDGCVSEIPGALSGMVSGMTGGMVDVSAIQFTGEACFSQLASGEAATTVAAPAAPGVTAAPGSAGLALRRDVTVMCIALVFCCLSRLVL